MTNDSDIVKALADVSVDENTKVFTNDTEKTNFAIFANENGIITLDNVNSSIKKVDTTSPKSISIYASNFDNKDYLVDFLDEYNDQAAEGDTVEYSDLMGTLFESVDLILNAITYVLVAFVSISLIVSSIMIGIITYISVLERTKEIGVLRSIGASKGDIGRVFNAETIIIGLVSGLFGVIVTILLNLPITALLTKITGASMMVRLPFTAGFILVMISVLFTTIAGLIPSRIASKKDPVVALRTE
jgi:putative ABC transport system permease protein